VPLAATVVGALVLRRDPARLFRLFYAVEAPLFVLALGRLFLVRELTPGVAYVLLVSVVGISAYVYRLLRDAEETRPLGVLLALAGDTVRLWAAGYAAALLAFFAVPIGCLSVATFFRLRWLVELVGLLKLSPGAAVLIVLGAGLVVASGTLFGLLPPAL